MLKLAVTIVFPLSLVSFVFSDRLRDLGNKCCPFQEIEGEKYRHVKNVATSVNDQCKDGCIYEETTKPGSRFCFNETVGTGECWADYQGFEMINPKNNPLTYWTLAVGDIRHGPGEVEISEEQADSIVTSLKTKTQSYNKKTFRFAAGASVSAKILSIFSAELKFDTEYSTDKWTEETDEQSVEIVKTMKSNLKLKATLDKNDIFLIAFEMKLYVFEIKGIKYHFTVATGRTMDGVFDKSSLENMYLDDTFSGIAKLYNLYNVRSLEEMADVISPEKYSNDTEIQVVAIGGPDNLKVISQRSSEFPPIPSERILPAAGFLDNTLVVCGGVAPWDSCIQIGETDETWQVGPKLNVGRRLMTINKVGNVLVAIGGTSVNNTAMTSTEVLQDGVWTMGFDLALGRNSHCTVTISDEEVIILGGNDPVMKNVIIFNINTGVSNPTFPLDTPKFGCACGMLDDDHIIVAGGIGSDGNPVLTVEILKLRPLNTFDWKTITQIPQTSRGFLHMVDGQINVYGNGLAPRALYYFHSLDSSVTDYTNGVFFWSFTAFTAGDNVKIAIPLSFRRRRG